MKCRKATCAALLISILASLPACGESSYEDRRAALVNEIRRDVERTSAYTGIARLRDSVTTAMARVPRHEFVRPALRAYAYANRALPIGEGQTISQPFIVALMTELAAVGPASVVLEVGTGSGYQAAVLAEMADHVYTIEIVKPLGRRAAETLERLGYDNVTVRIGDGYLGWPEVAPFDAIVVTAAPEKVPPPLIRQLKVGGRLVVPVGSESGSQSLQVLEKDRDGNVSTTNVLPVMFVPFTRDD